MHYWGDDWEYWDDLEKAITFIGNYVHKYSRCRLVMKEKWGCIRYEWLIVPGATFYKPFYISFPFYRYDRFLKEKVQVTWHWESSWLCRKWRAYGYYITRKAVKKACELFPHIKDEILEDFDWFIN